MIAYRRIPEQSRRLGRHVQHDPRSLNFPAEKADVIKDVWHKATGLPLDQGNRGSCTAQALCGALNTAPNFKGTLQTEANANAYYDQEIVVEGGNPQTDDPGGTGLLICQVAQKDGLISSYQHAFGLDEALKALMVRPVITGVNWYDSADRPDSKGFIQITPDAAIRGGHEFVVFAISVMRKAVACWQSWGPEWGPWGGRFWMPFDVWGRLLSEQGDVTVPIV